MALGRTCCIRARWLPVSLLCEAAEGARVNEQFLAYLRGRGISLTEMEPGVVTPLRFSDRYTEHWATRRRAGLFDFSFMSCFQIEGDEARAFLKRLQTRNLARLLPGGFLYTLLLREDGTVHIDATLWDLGQGRYWIITGRRSDRQHLEDVASGMDVSIEDRSGRDAVFALQGPASHAILADVLGDPDLSLRYFGFRRMSLCGESVLIARAGYSGEAGYEILVDSACAVRIWNRLAEACHEWGGMECGLECIDSLRVEAGLILFSRELAWRLTPQTLGLGRLVEAPGCSPWLRSAKLCSQRNPDESLKLVGLMPLREPIPPPDQPPVANATPVIATGHVVVTSRVDSPLWGHDLGMGLVRVDDGWPGTRVTAANGTRMVVARLPFYDPQKRLPRAPAAFPSRNGSR